MVATALVVITLCVLLSTAVAALVFRVWRHALQPKKRKSPQLLGRKYTRANLLTPGETAFFSALVRAVPPTHRVFAKPRLADLVMPVSGGFDQQIAMKHVDFILFNRTTTAVDLVIELDDKSHRRADRAARDAFVDHVLLSATIPVLRVPVAQAYDPIDLGLQIKTHIFR